VNEIINANRYLGPAILIVYFIFVDLILVSMLIAVIEEAFSRAQEDLREHRDDDKLLQSFQSQVNHLKSFTSKKWSSVKSKATRLRSGSNALSTGARFSDVSKDGANTTNPFNSFKKKKLSFGTIVKNAKSQAKAAKTRVALRNNETKQPGTDNGDKIAARNKKVTPFDVGIDLPGNDTSNGGGDGGGGGGGDDKRTSKGSKYEIESYSLNDNSIERKKVERNIKGLKSANARRRRQSHNALIKHFEQSRVATQPGEVSNDALHQLNSRLFVMEEKMKKIDSIEATLNEILQHLQQQQPQSRGRRITEQHKRVSTQLPDNWSKHHDATHERNYYIDPETGNSQWEKPGQST
jgi:hypothetical protein